MPRANYSITVCLIFLGLAVLVRTVAIAQRACDVLLPPTSCDYWGHAIAPIAIGYTGGPAASSSVEPTAAIHARPVVNIPVTNPPSVEDSPPDAAPEDPPEGVASRADHQFLSEVASEKQPKRIAPTNASHRRRHEASSGLKKGTTTILVRADWPSKTPGEQGAGKFHYGNGGFCSQCLAKVQSARPIGMPDCSISKFRQRW
jgi:hypothetical protein